MTEDSKVYGRHPVLELLKSERRAVHRILLARGTKGPQLEQIERLAKVMGVEVVLDAREALDRLAGTDTHQGVIAVCGGRTYSSLDEILDRAATAGEPALVVVADGIEDPGNLGNLLRSAESAGAHGIVIPRHRAVGMTPTVAKASAGASEHVLLAQETNLSQTFDRLREKEIWIVGADAGGETVYDRVDFTMPTALVVGGEGKGIRAVLREKCDVRARIPMHGKVATLNAATSAAVLLFEARRQRRASTALA